MATSKQQNHKRVSKKILQGMETAEMLLSIARELFAQRGYAATTTCDVLARAEVTKGALYHHFGSKLNLFEAVYQSVESEVSELIDAASAIPTTPFDKLLAGCYAYLDACRHPGRQRILRLDGPAVLGQNKWANIDRQYGYERLLPFLTHLNEIGIIAVPSVAALTHQITGAMNASSFWIAQHPEPERALQESKQMLSVLLNAVRQ